MATIKVYRTTRNRRLADGTVKQIEVTRKYEVHPKVTPEQIVEIRAAHRAGSTKQDICNRHGLSRYLVGKVLAGEDAQ